MADQPQRIDENLGQLGAGGGGSNDVDSGAGAASGIPDADTAEHAGDVVNRGNVADDRKRLFGDDAPSSSTSSDKTNPD